MVPVNTPHELLKQYIPLANFIAQVCGNQCEVVLRDYVEDTSTILHIVNGRLSDRSVGDTLSGYGLHKIMKGNWRDCDSVSNYIIINETNQRVFRASVFYIKMDEELIGLLCVNYDLTEFLQHRDFYQNEILYGLPDAQTQSREYFNESLDSILDGIIRNVFITWDRSIPVNRVEQEGNPIRQLSQLNVFSYKGAVNRVAELLGLSPQTVYRYIKDIDRAGEESPTK